MKQTEELRERVNDLESAINKEVEKFINEVGACEININTDLQTINQVGEENYLMFDGIKVHITI